MSKKYYLIVIVTLTFCFSVKSQTHIDAIIQNDVHVNKGVYSTNSTGDGKGNLVLFGDGGNGAGWQSTIKWSGIDGFDPATSSGTRVNAEITIGNVGSYGIADLIFKTKGTYDNAAPTEKMRILKNGNVGIGSAAPDSKLTVKGKIHAEEVKVDLSVPGPDYVFANDYDLPSLEELQKYIQKNRHLPNIPSASEMEANGVELGVMNMKLLEKIEELTLYTLTQEKRLENQLEKIKKLEQQNSRIEALEEKLEILLKDN